MRSRLLPAIDKKIEKGYIIIMERKPINLWYKIRTYYRYHWMDQDLLFKAPVARPFWLMTHTDEQIRQYAATHQESMAKMDDRLIITLRSALRDLKSDENQ